MRLMWLWVLLYAVILGPVLFGLGLALCFGFAWSPLGGITGDVGEIGCSAATFSPMGGFVALIAGVILFIISAKSVAGRVVSLVGISLYHVAALGVVLATTVTWFGRGFSTEVIYAVAAAVVAVVLPGVFIARRLRRAP